MGPRPTQRRSDRDGHLRHRHFKAYNDRHGHPGGDTRLIAVARAIASIESDAFAALVNAADAALYAAKEGGRDRMHA